MEASNVTDPYLYVVTVRKTKFPKYREYIKNGWPLPAQPYSLSVNRASPGETILECTYYMPNGNEDKTTKDSPNSSYIRDNFSMVRNVKSSLDDQLFDLTKHQSNRLLSKVQAQALPLIQMYKERRETGKMVLSMLDKMLFAAKNVRHPKRVLFCLGIYDSQRHTNAHLRSLKKRIMSSKTVGDALLQYQFGWKPLMSDIYSSYMANAEREKKGRSFRQRVGNRFSFTAEADSDTGYGDRMTATREGWTGISICYHITDETLASVGMIDNPAAAAWDFVPWSFVVDWAVDISTYLSLQTATVGTSLTSGCETVFYKDLITFPATRYSYYPESLTYRWGGRKYTHRSTIPPRQDVSMKRTILTSYPAPQLEYPLKGTLIHGVELLALVNQRRSTLSRLFRSRI